MTNDEIKDLIKDLIQIVKETGMVELEVQRGDSRVRIRGQAPEYVASVPPYIAAAIPQAAPLGTVSSPTPAGSSAGHGGAPRPEELESLVLVKSPIVGTFYGSPSPDSPPFVKTGDRVVPGQVLCIVEAMKLMNEIQSDVAGIVVAQLVENAHPVEYGEALFSIRPA